MNELTVIEAVQRAEARIRETTGREFLKLLSELEQRPWLQNERVQKYLSDWLAGAAAQNQQRWYVPQSRFEGAVSVEICVMQLPEGKIRSERVRGCTHEDALAQAAQYVVLNPELLP